ncbi:unnamed protein product [Durusdinium trenchii]|uniref:Uncharacterized protein n=2 Tax=Durusdinium trenchii TaxID=1381693 RepID=A0ABP0M6N5_9DINO
MGSYLCREEVPVEHGHHVHKMCFPMYVLKVSDFLELGGAPPPHSELEEKGLLYEWKAGMFVLFVSHQWLHTAHPDPCGSQSLVLREVLEGLMQGTLTVETDLISQTYKSQQSFDEQELLNAYIWMDWFSIPQVRARARGIDEEETRTEASKAIQSIPAYVEVSSAFVALVPAIKEQSSAHGFDYTTWITRGWCRAELWCHLLSTKKDTSVIVVHSSKEVKFMYPMDWQYNLISDGEFTVEEDREVVVQLGDRAVEHKIKHLGKDGPVDLYRFYLAHRGKLLGQAKRERTLEEFLDHFRFPNLEAAVNDTSSMNATLCAMFASDVGMLRVLAYHKADLNMRMKGLSALGYYDSQTLLMAAAKSRQGPEVLSALIELRADVNARSNNGMNCAFLARTPEQVQVFIEAKADLHSHCEPLGLTPLAGVAAMASPDTVRAMLDAAYDPNPQPCGVGHGPLHGAIMVSRGNRYAAETARLLLEHKADVNSRCAPSGNFRWKSIASCTYASIMGLDSISQATKQLACLSGGTPLDFAAFVGDEELIRLLWQYGAEPLGNDIGVKPKDWAFTKGHTRVFRLLDTFTV